MQRNPVATSADDLWGWKESDDGVAKQGKSVKSLQKSKRKNREDGSSLGLVGGWMICTALPSPPLRTGRDGLRLPVLG